MAAPAYRQAVSIAQAQLDELVQHAGIARVRGLFRDMEADLERALARAQRFGSEFTAHQQRGFLLVVRSSIMRMAGPLAHLVKTGAAQAMAQSIRTLAQQIALLERHFVGGVVPMPLLEVARFRGLIDRRVTSLLVQHQRSVARYGASAIRQAETAMARGLATAASTTRVMDDVQDAISGTRWQAERIVRTELAWSTNAGHHDGLVAQVQAMPDLWGRWSEHCSDTGDPVPLDARVGVDSIAMHGQLARPGGAFTEPPTAPVPTVDGETEVPASLALKTFAHPPNRPMDRSVVTPWRPAWGDVGGWVWRGARVPVTAANEARLRAG